MQRTWYIGNSREKLEKVLAALAHFLLRPEDDYEIVIREHRKARSIAQNRYYWALIGELARHDVQGQRFIAESWHEYFKGRFIGKEEIRLPNGDIFNRPISTTTLDVGQFAEYVTQIEAWAAGHGILLGGDESAASDRRAA